MEIKYTEGCISYGLTVDGKDTSDCKIKELQDMVHKVIDSLNRESDRGTLQQFLIDIAQTNHIQSTVEFIYHCDQCGDDVYEYTFKL